MQPHHRLGRMRPDLHEVAELVRDPEAVALRPAVTAHLPVGERVVQLAAVADLAYDSVRVTPQPHDSLAAAVDDAVARNPTGGHDEVDPPARAELGSVHVF